MPESPHLLLFDIDGTLVDTGGVGMSALQSAFAELYPEEVEAIGGAPELDLAGSTDAGIAMELFGKIGLEDSPAERERFFGRYLEKLHQGFGEPGVRGTLLEGVELLLGELARMEELALGLLTGNIAGGARAKVDYYGIGHHFAWGAYGDDHHDRDRLGPIAVGRAEEHLGRDLSAARATVIGDTPKDIKCARAMGARVVAVATGRFAEAELAAYQPDAVLPDFADVAGAKRAIEG